MPTQRERRGALIIFGSGPGIGVHVATRFARGGFEKVILLSRNAARLGNDAFIVYSNAPQVEVSTVSADLASATDLQRALRKIGDIVGDTPIECIHYNATKASRTLLLEESAGDLRANLEISVVSLYTVAKWAIPRLLVISGHRPYKPAFLVTSGWLAMYPEPNFFAMGVCKAAQQNIIHSLHDQLSNRGVHCALAMVNGFVHAEADSTNPGNIAEECWDLYSSRGNGRMDLETQINEDGDMDSDGLESIRQWNSDHPFEM